MPYRDDRQAQIERLAHLERRAREADELVPALERLELENRRLRAKLAEYTEELERLRPGVLRPSSPSPYLSAELDDVWQLERQDRWADACALLRRRAGETDDRGTQVEALSRLAQLRLEKFRDRAGAVEACRRALDAGAFGGWTLMPLVAVARACEDPDMLVTALERACRGETEPTRRAALLGEIGQLHDRLHNSDRAHNAYATLARIDPVHPLLPRRYCGIRSAG